MSKVFSNRKLFGKINIIDIIILVIFIAGIIIGYKYLSRSNRVITNLTEQKFSIVLKESKQEIQNYINIGDKVYDNENNNYIGEVVSFEIIPSERIIKDYDNEQFVSSKVDGLVDVRLLIKASLKDNKTDFKTTEDYEIRVGKDIFLRGPNYSGKGYVVSFER